MSQPTFASAAARLNHSASVLLGWRPHEFWNATPAELALAIAPPDETCGGPERCEIEALMARFPDHERQ